MCEGCARRNIALLGSTYEALRLVFGPHHKAGGESVVWLFRDRAIKLTVMSRRAYLRLREVLRMPGLPIVQPTELRAVRALPGGMLAVYGSQPRVALFRGRMRGARPQTTHPYGRDVVLFYDGHWNNFDRDGRLLDFGSLFVEPGPDVIAA